jgi:hypothetical protein
MIQNAENVVPNATIAVESKQNQRGARERPNSRMPKKLASKAKVVKVSLREKRSLDRSRHPR